MSWSMSFCDFSLFVSLLITKSALFVKVYESPLQPSNHFWVGFRRMNQSFDEFKRLFVCAVCLTLKIANLFGNGSGSAVCTSNHSVLSTLRNEC